MNKLSKLFRALILLIRKPYLLNMVIDDDANWQEHVEKEYGMGKGLPEVLLKKLLKNEVAEVSHYAFMEGGSLPTDLALLKTLAATFRDCRYFEIGTWRGESAANIAPHAREVFTLNLPIKNMRNEGRDEDYIGQYAMFSREYDNITHLQGDSLVYDFAALKKTFDLVFIDGDHHFASIKKDTESTFKHLLHEKSIVVWHDYAWQPGNVRYETLAAILAGLPDGAEKHLYAVRNTMCAMYFPGKIDSFPPTVIAKADEAFSVKIQ